MLREGAVRGHLPYSSPPKLGARRGLRGAGGEERCARPWRGGCVERAATSLSGQPKWAFPTRQCVWFLALVPQCQPLHEFGFFENPAACFLSHLGTKCLENILRVPTKNEKSSEKRAIWPGQALCRQVTRHWVAGTCFVGPNPGEHPGIGTLNLWQTRLTVSCRKLLHFVCQGARFKGVIEP